jgi:hypothetical protein
MSGRDVGAAAHQKQAQKSQNQKVTLVHTSHLLLKGLWLKGSSFYSLTTSPPFVPFRVSFDPEDLRIEGNLLRVNPLSISWRGG